MALLTASSPLLSFSYKRLAVHSYVVPECKAQIRHGLLENDVTVNLGALKVYQPQRFFYNGVAPSLNDRFFHAIKIGENLISLTVTGDEVVFQDDFIHKKLSFMEASSVFNHSLNYTAHLVNKSGLGTKQFRSNHRVFLYVLQGEVSYSKRYTADFEKMIEVADKFDSKELDFSNDAFVLLLECHS